MFKNLVASEGKKRRTWTPTTATASILLHALLIGGAVYASIAAPKSAEKEQELVEFMDIPEEEVPEEKPTPPPPPPPEPETPATPPPPKGFQELIPPAEPPPAIPDVDPNQQAVSAEDFTGVGQAGGTAKGVEGGTPQPVVAPVDSSNFAYEVAVLERKPELSNKGQVASLLQRLYPRMLQDAGIEGTVVMQFVITEKGEVEPSSVKVISSTHEQFASASEKAVERFRFRPGKYKGKDVRVLIQMPIAWKPQE